ncbi:MAG: DUF1127 domain-containing protein [Hyphomicrobiaceae bacterium]
MSQSLKMEMTALETAELSSKWSPAGLWRRLSESFALLADENARRRKRRRAILELQRLDDRLLKDIGITRGEIPYVVSHGRETSHGWL